MPVRSFHLDAVSADAVAPLLAALRQELTIPGEFAPDALAEAEASAGRGPAPTLAEREDARDLELVTIDPPGARDLDQAMHLARDGAGYLVSYAIADPAAFIEPGSALDEAVRARGTTLYGPDGRVPLHPAVLSEGAASLLEGQDRPANLWRIRLDAGGEITDATVTRAAVRSRAQLTYEDAQRLIAAPEPHMLDLLREIGEKRAALELARGGASLAIPQQEVHEDDGGYTLVYRGTLPVEDWNAQISLLTGIAAARLMRRGRIGVLRTLPTADPRDVRRLRLAAKALGVDWPKDQPYGELLDGLDPNEPRVAAFLQEATTLFRGAGYLSFDGELPPASPHGAIAAEYAHVTAPLRRLVDRFGLEICLAVTAGAPVPAWVREALPTLPELMARAGNLANAYERETVNLIEAFLLKDRVGETFEAVVVDVAEPRKPRNGAPAEPEAPDADQRGTVVLADPAVRAEVRGPRLPLGERATVRLATADPASRKVSFTYPA